MTRRPVLLDLFCKAGGATRGDALDVLRDLVRFKRWMTLDGTGLVAIHASPPCQAHSDLSWHPQNRHVDYPELVGPTRDHLLELGLPYVIENVEGAPLLDPVMLCGSAFGLGVQRHRLFESNVPMMSPGCSHGAMPKRFKVWRHGREYMSAFVPVYGTGGGKAAEHWPEAMGIDWMTRAELSQAIPPAYTEHIGGYLMRAVERERALA